MAANVSLGVPTQVLNNYQKFIQMRDDLPDVVMINYSQRGYTTPQDSRRITNIRYGGIEKFGRNTKVDGVKDIKLEGAVIMSEIKEFTRKIALTNLDIQTQRENLVKISASVLKGNLLASVENDLYQTAIKSAKQYDCQEGDGGDDPTTLTEDDIRNVELSLNKANCRRMLPYIEQPVGADRYNVNNVAASFVFVVPTETERNIKKYIPDLKSPETYGWSGAPYVRDIGQISRTRIIASNYLDNYMEKESSTSGKNVYTGFLFGKDAIGNTIIPELTQIFFQDPKMISPGATEGFIVSKIFGSSVVLNPNWIYKVKFTV